MLGVIRAVVAAQVEAAVPELALASRRALALVAAEDRREARDALAVEAAEATLRSAVDPIPSARRF